MNRIFLMRNLLIEIDLKLAVTAGMGFKLFVFMSIAGNQLNRLRHLRVL
jgi:hypothetical protein